MRLVLERIVFLVLGSIVVFSLSTLASSSSVPSSSSSSLSTSPVTIQRYELWYKSGERDINQEMFSPRPIMPQVLDDGYYICYEDYGDNIEVIIDINNNFKNTSTTTSSSTTTTRIDRVEMILRDRKRNLILTSRTERVLPYFLYGDNGRSNIFGKTLHIGKYELLVTVYATTTISTTGSSPSSGGGLRLSSNNTTGSIVASFEKKQRSTTTSITSRTIQLDVIECAFFHPPNECSWCPSTSSSSITGTTTTNIPAIGGGTGSKTCFGSSCISTGYFRISLLTIGGNPFRDVAISIITPYGTIISTLPSSGAVTSDSTTGGYVDENTFNVVSCKEIGVYVKNIMFPDPSLVPGGNYTIQVQSVPVCGGGGDGDNDPTNPSAPITKPFELYVYFKNEIVAFYSNSDGTTFHYQLT